jgi:hypothetical protein
MRSEVWRPAATARNRSPREVREVARQALRPRCEELALRIRVMPETEARPQRPKPPRWSAERRASRVISAFTRVLTRYGTQGASQAPGLPRHVQAQRVFRRAPERLSALRPPSIRVSEAMMQTPGADMRRGNDGGCCFGEVGPQARVVPAKAGIHDHCQWLWIPALAALGRDDDGLVRAKNQPAAVRNGHRLGLPVSGLLFTGSGATATCRAFQRPSRIQVAARLPTSSRSPIKPANTGSTPMPRTTLASRVRSPSQSSPW